MLVTAMSVAPVAPPEHAHEAEEHGHHFTVIHRHFEQHHAGDHSSRHHAVIDHDEDPILTLATVYTVPPLTSVDSPLEIVADEVETFESPCGEWSAADVDILIHGPPRAPTSLRAPPISPAS
jgi:hypothetical protein